MVSENQDTDGSLVIKLEGALSAYEVSDLKDRLLTEFTNHQGIVLDINGVTECDTLGVQLVLSAKKTADKLKKVFSVSGNSDAVKDAATGVGLEAEDFPFFFKEA